MKHADMFVALFDLNGGLLFSTDKFANLFGGLYFNDKLETQIYQLMQENNPQIIEQLISIRNKVKETKTEYHYLLNLCVNSGINTYRVTSYPVFSPDGEVIATEIRAKVFYWFPINQILKNELVEKHKLSSANINLSLRQKQIIFYLLLGYPQQTIGEILNISRGTIAKMIAEDICPKFNLNGASANMLTRAIMEYDYQHLIPNGIINVPKVVMIN